MSGTYTYSKVACDIHKNYDNAASHTVCIELVLSSATILVWSLVSSWFDYCGLLLNTKFDFTCLSG